MIGAVLEVPRSDLEQATSGRAGCTRESRTEGARVVRDVCEVRCCAPRPRIRSALGICGARGKRALSVPESPPGPALRLGPTATRALPCLTRPVTSCWLWNFGSPYHSDQHSTDETNSC